MAPSLLSAALRRADGVCEFDDCGQIHGADSTRSPIADRRRRLLVSHYTRSAPVSHCIDSGSTAQSAGKIVFQWPSRESRVKAGGEIDRRHPTQVGRALKQLRVEHIEAYSAEARGRSERAFQTLQDRPRA